MEPSAKLSGVVVPARLFPHLARLFFQQPVEAQIKCDFLKVRQLEQRAYRKLQETAKRKR